MRDLATAGFCVAAMDARRSALIDQTLDAVGEINPELWPIFGSDLFSVSSSATPKEHYTKLREIDGGVRAQLVLAHARGGQLTEFSHGVSQVQR